MSDTATRRRDVAAGVDPATRLRRLAGRVRRLGDLYRGDADRAIRERQALEDELLAIANALDRMKDPARAVLP